jgi:hypothetical protein
MLGHQFSKFEMGHTAFMFCVQQIFVNCLAVEIKAKLSFLKVRFYMLNDTVHSVTPQKDFLFSSTSVTTKSLVCVCLFVCSSTGYADVLYRTARHREEF